MMEQVLLFFSTALVAIVVENAVFARGLGLNQTALMVDSPKKCLVYGAALAWLATISAIPVGVFIQLFAEAAYGRLVRTPLFLLSVAAVYVATYLAAKYRIPAIFPAIREVLPAAGFNTALFGAFYVAVLQSYSIVQTVGYALGSAVGCAVAMLIIYYARKRLMLCMVPRSFRGLPILLVYLGLLSLALYGLLGHGLPS